VRVAVTGGTGYVGAHIVRALLTSGHQVRLLVLPAETGAPVLAELGALGDLDIITGNIRTADTVETLLGDCAAVIHAAGVVGTDRRRTELMWAVNAHSGAHIVTRAVSLGLDPVVLVSSYSALFPPPTGQLIGPDTPTAPGKSPYAKTKAYAERAARRLQDDGAPVVVTYPASVVGPAFHTAPGVTERGWQPILRGRIAPRLHGAMQMVDVRDIAQVHARLLQPGRGPRRYLCGGELLSFDEMIDALAAGLGRPIRRIPLSGGVFAGVGRLADLLGTMVPLGDGLSHEAAMLLTAGIATDDTQTLTDLGITWRSARQSIISTVATGRTDPGAQQGRDTLPEFL